MSESKNTGKRGRKTGTADVVHVSIEQLLKYIPAATVLPVRRKWLESIENLYNVSFTGVVRVPVADPTEVHVSEEKAGTAAEAVVRPRVDISQNEEEL